MLLFTYRAKGRPQGHAILGEDEDVLDVREVLKTFESVVHERRVLVRGSVCRDGCDHGLRNACLCVWRCMWLLC
jgi:hypothetical protein